tara:strand:- start:1651 stop:1887 length:237 start_codon:yes stop_codon:yes gene_type:complete
MKGCLYDYTFTLPNKEFKEQKALNMKDLCIAIKKDLQENYFIDDVNINNQVLYNLQKRPQYCSKILKNRISISKCVSV